MQTIEPDGRVDHSAKFFIDELNDTIHESLIQELSYQLSKEARQYEGFYASGAITVSYTHLTLPTNREV